MRRYIVGLSVNVVLTLTFFCLGIWTALNGCDPHIGGSCASTEAYFGVTENAPRIVDNDCVLVTYKEFSTEPYDHIPYYNVYCNFCPQSSAPALNESLALLLQPKYNNQNICYWKEEDFEKARMFTIVSYIVWLFFLPLSIFTMTYLSCVVDKLKAGNNPRDRCCRW